MIQYKDFLNRFCCSGCWVSRRAIHYYGMQEPAPMPFGVNEGTVIFIPSNVLTYARELYERHSDAVYISFRGSRYIVAAASRPGRKDTRKEFGKVIRRAMHKKIA